MAHKSIYDTTPSRRWMIYAPVTIVIICLAYYGLSRWNAYDECFEVNVESPLWIVDNSEFVALARLTRAMRIMTAHYSSNVSNDSSYIVECTFAIVSLAKGDTDSLQVWIYESPKSLDRDQQEIGATFLVYGRQILHEDSLGRIATGLYTPGGSDRFAQSLVSSPELRDKFANRDLRIPILYYPDRGMVMVTHHYWDAFCYYDEEGSARFVSREEYWENVLEAVEVQKDRISASTKSE